MSIPYSAQNSEAIPTNLSQLTNDLGFITSSSIFTNTSQLINNSGFITVSSIPSNTSDLVNDSNFITTSSLPTNTSDLVNDSNFITSSSLPTNTSQLTNNSGFITITSVPTNVSTLTNDSAFITAASLPTNTSQLTNNSNFITAASLPTNTSQLNNNSGFITITSVPTNVSSLTNDSAYITASSLPSFVSDLGNDTGFITTSSLPTNVSDLINDSAFITASSLPTNVSTLNNDSAFITASSLPTNVSELNNDSAYITTSSLPTNVSTLNNDSAFITASSLPTNVSELSNDSAFITASSLPTNVSELSNDSAFITASSLPTNVSELSNDSAYITASSLPTNVSELSNDSAFITAASLPTDFYSQSHIDSALALKANTSSPTFTGKLVVDTTGQDSTNKYGLVVGDNEGNVGISVNDGGGNANVTFNNHWKVPDSTDTTQSTGRISCGVDDPNSHMFFQLRDTTTINTLPTLTEVLRLTESTVLCKKDTSVTGDLSVTGNIINPTLTGKVFIDTTGQNSTNQYGLVVGNGSGNVGLSVDDGEGDASITFNHHWKVPDSTDTTQSAARILTYIDSTDARLNIQLGRLTTQGTSVALSNMISILKNTTNTRIVLHENVEAYGNLSVTGTITNTTLTGRLDTTDTNITAINDRLDSARVLIGEDAGLNNQNSATSNVAIGKFAQYQNSYGSAVAVGNQAGFSGQQQYSVALGAFAGYSNQHDHSICINGTGSQFNTGAADAFFVKPLRLISTGNDNITLCYYTESGEIYYRETGFLHTYISSGISLNSTSFANLNLQTTTIGNTRLYSKSGNTITILKAGFYQFFFNMPHRKSDTSSSGYRISVRCAIHQNGNIVGTSSAYSYIRNTNNIFNDNCSTTILLECSVNDLITLRYQRKDDTPLSCVSEMGRFSITKV